MTEETSGEGELPMFVGEQETRLTLRDAPDSLDDIRVTLHHACGKRVDVANEHLELDGVTVVFRDQKAYANLYADESESNEYRVTVEWRDDE